MNDAIGRIAAIILGVFALFYIPILIIGLKADNTSQGYIDNAVVEFVDNARTCGKITPEAYENLCRKIDTIQPFCEIELTHSEKIATLNEVGEVEYSYYNTGKIDILDYMYPASGSNRDYELKLGDFINVTVYNTQPTLGTKVYRFIMPFYAPNDTVLYSTYSGFVGNYME